MTQESKDNINTLNDPDMLPEYDFSGGTRGKYARKFKEGTNVVALEPDVYEVFPDSESVNEALRALIRVSKLAQNKHQA